MDDVEANRTRIDAAPIPKLEINRRPMLASAVFIGLGGVLGMTGAALGSYALMAATRRWVRTLDTPPREIARRGWVQGKAAGIAVAEGWRHGPTPVVSPSVMVPPAESGA